MNERKTVERRRRINTLRRRKRQRRARRRIFTFILLLLVILSVPSLTYNIKAKNLYDVTYSVYNVKANDTLWSIAQDITDEHTDVRETIYNIKKLNNLEKGCTLEIGQTIKLPTDF